MKYTVLTMETYKEGYTPKQCDDTLTVSELIDLLQNYDEDMPVFFSNDDGYTYGSISEYRIRRRVFED